MHYLFLFVFFYISTFQLNAQVPEPGIYQLNRDQNNFFETRHYTRFFNSIDNFLSMQIVPYKEVSDYRLEYALVAVNAEHTQLKIAFLRDTISTKGKQIFASVIQNTPDAKEAYFTKEFLIQKDSVTTSSNYESSFISSENLTGNWFFSKNDDYFGIYKNPLIENQSIKNSTSGTYQNGKNYQFEQAFFVRHGKRPLPYLDLHINKNKDKILIYDQPKSHAVVKDYFRKNEYIAITADSFGEWYGIDRIELKKDNKRYYTMDSGIQEGTTFLHTTSGWIKKEDLATNPWIKQKQQTKQFRFEISADKEFLQAVKIIHKKTGKQQVFLDLWAELRSTPIDVIQISDYNFDGYPDFMFLMQAGGAGPNYTNNFYLYNPKNDDFEYNDELSQLSQIQIDTKRQIISSDWRDGAAHHGGEKYRFINQRLTKIAYWDQYALSDFFTHESSGELINGKWVDHHYKGAEILYPATAVYKTPYALTVTSDTVSRGDYALIKDENALFFYTEISTINSGLVKGWVSKESFLPLNKSMYTKNTPLYYFELTRNHESIPVAVKVNSQSNGKTVQIITDIDGIDSTVNTLCTADYNFDGITDFSLRTSTRDDVDANNIYENYYLYDKTTSLFKIDTILSTLPNLNFNLKNKKISSTRFTKKDNVFEKQKKIYTIREDKYVLMNDTNESETDDIKL